MQPLVLKMNATDFRAAETRILLKAVRRLARALDMQSHRIDRAAGLTLPQYVVLRSAAVLGGPTVSELADEADLTAPTVVGVLDKLEAKGLIERRRSTQDRRAVHVALTKAGSDALAAAPDPLGEAFRARFDRLAEPERRALVAALARLADLAEPVEHPGG